MSINVHVSGNPISISRGKMVTSDLNCPKKEYEKRRLMRLEQVRQQSKNIAEDVRNKVKQEKIMQMRQIEEEGKQKLKNWQNRKLLELQTQYKKAIKELGTGHKEAQKIEDQEELLEKKKIVNEEVSAKRGHSAACKLHCKQYNDMRKKDAILDRKKIVREIENTRAALLSNFKNAKHTSEPNIKKKKHDESDSDLNILIPESDSQEGSNSLSDIMEDQEEPSSSCTCEVEDFEILDVEDTAKKKSQLDSRYYDGKNSDIPINTPKQIVSSTQMASPVHLQSVPSTSMQVPPPVSTHTPSQRQYIHSASKLHGSHIAQEQISLDTRISDRIKRRDTASKHPELTVLEPIQIPDVQSSTAVRDFIHSRTCYRSNLGRLDSDDGFKESFNSRVNVPPTENNLMVDQFIDNVENKSKSKCSEESKTKIIDIPSKPFIKLKSAVSDTKGVQSKSPSKRIKPRTSPLKVIPLKRSNKDITKTDSVINISDNLSKHAPDYDNFDELSKPSFSKQHPIQIYDHPNRFGYEKNIPSSSFVEKIPPESLEVISDPYEEENWLEAQRQQQKNAQIRGRQALEKVKIQKDYEEMMKRLPLLQKKERIKEIYNDKPEYHMTEERLKEKVQVKQNSIENTYNKLFPDLKPAVVTISKKSQTNGEQQIESPNPAHTLNIGNWDVDHKETQQTFSAEEVKDILKAFARQNPQDRRAKLKQLLKQLQLQKEELLWEISALPKDESVNELINDLRSFDDECEEKTKSKHKKTTPRKRSRKENEADVSTDSSAENSSSELTKAGNKEVLGKSPRKKPKIKQKVIILQNTSTQTTPKPSIQENIPKKVATIPAQKYQEESAPRFCSEIHIPCDCNKENKKSSENMCHIFIKLNDNNDKPEVIVKSKDEEHKKSVETKSVDVGVQISPELSKKTTTKKPVPVKTKIDSTMERSTTWKDNFSKNSASTTSTSYFSPPDFHKFKTAEKSSDYFKKPQQKELSTTNSTQISHEDIEDPKIKLYVKKLLGMTRVSVENLSVSSSNVATPSQSIIEMESNNPRKDLQELIDCFKNRINNVTEGLSCSPENSPVPFNTSVSGTGTSSEFSRKKTATRNARPENESTDSTKIKSNCTVETCTSTKAKSKDNLLAQYTEITDTCSKRIEALAAMIQQLREDKIRMMQVPKHMSTGSVVHEGKDVSTTYMDLPEYKAESQESSKPSSSSLDEDEMYKKLMDIDYEYIDKMRQLNESVKNRKLRTLKPTATSSPLQTTSSNDVQLEVEEVSQSNDINNEILERLQQLHNPQEAASTSENQNFVSFLSDIPRLPKFEPHENNFGQQNHKRPPPSKGLTNIKKLNGNVTLVPHELSTIVEAESQISTKVTSPEVSRDSIHFPQQLLIIPEIPENTSSPTDESKSSLKVSMREEGSSISNIKSFSTSPKDVSFKSLVEPSSSLEITNKSNEVKKKYICDQNSCPEKCKTSQSSSSSDDLETIENMLRSIGMDWAIPTLHKTQEALALTSSSSSLDLSKKVRETHNNGSEINLKEYLKQKIVKISSSTMLTDGSLGSFLGENPDLSGIQKGSGSAQDRSKQRTSTPLGSSKFMSSSKSNSAFSDSDLSSIKQESTKFTKNKNK